MNAHDASARERDQVASPCISVCVLDPGQQYCLGCGRTLHEIATWVDLSADDKRTIIAALPARLAEDESR
ncbi:MAG: DUF1289 domain-containing protein [Casimicrobiaceae bacterium]